MIPTSLATQNFRKRSTVFRWTPKKNLIWLLNNAAVLYISNLQLSLRDWTNAVNLTNKHIFQILFRYGFNKTLVKKSASALFFRHHPVGFNLHKTLKYWILTNGIMFIQETHEPKPTFNLIQLTRGSKLVYNSYYTTNPCFLSRSTQKTFKIVAFKFFTILPLSWVQWNRRHRIWVQHTYINNMFFLSRFLNVYFFKLLHF